MKTIRGKFTLLTIAIVIVSILTIGLVSIFSVKMEEDNDARERMLLICRAEQEELDAYLNSIEQSVQTVSRLAAEDLNSGNEDLSAHLSLMEQAFHSIATNTNGVLNYYYRVSPEVSDTDQGFLYCRKSNNEFVSTKLTDLSAYDPHDISHMGWYTLPKERGVPSWLDPYFNDNLGVRMISYVAPIYRHGVFFGVMGMDFKYSALVDQVKDIKVFDTGYAFLADAEGNVVYHPTLPTGIALTSVSEDLLRDRRGHQAPIVKYEANGVKKRVASAELSNGMFLYVTAPESEINAGWVRLMSIILGATVGLLVVSVLVTAVVVKRITEPLHRLTEAAIQVDAGNYDVKLDDHGTDEVGILTGAFRQLIDHLKVYISDLNSRAYTDALTSVRNKGAYTIYARKLQDRIDAPGEAMPEFALCMFDCNDLKITNDGYGHDKGDIYLKASCMLICKVFQHSPVFRMGGDEFATCLQGEDYRRREELMELLDQRSREINAQAQEPWQRVDMAKGMAVFDPAADKAVADVLKRADDAMYANKRNMKAERSQVRGTSSV